MAKNTVDPPHRRYLKVLEPWGGGHVPTDTGFGNRLLHWDACYILYVASGGEHFMDVESRYWHELSFFELPATRRQDLKHWDEDTQKWLGTWDFDRDNDEITRLPQIGNKEVKEFLKTGELELTEPRYFVKFDWDYIHKIFKKADKLKIPSGLRRIKYKNAQFKNIIQQFSVNTVGIHLRRGNGVYKSDKNYAELPEKVKKNKEYSNLLNDTIYKYWDDNVYIRLMKEMLEYNPKQRFYISCDLENDEYEYLKEKFPGKIIVRSDIIEKLPPYMIKDVYFDKYDCPKKIALNSVVDMMTLLHCNFIVGAPFSTWLDSILRMKKVPYQTIKEPRDKILADYQEALKTYNQMI